ncbi:hypothetical protein OIE43_10290 [Streptomyces pseudovenezuelae]|uniref:hypothetical protein n=1 Tax=Streptomyces pseudovenezuelae TaxID=67350 RepID=UPI002E3356AE|nr:hypothetical protein [Streptomyces pseudovenezuelae]
MRGASTRPLTKGPPAEVPDRRIAGSPDRRIAGSPEEETMTLTVLEHVSDAKTDVR